MTTEQFKQMIQQHDLDYMYSPRRAEQEDGSRSLAAIKEAAKLLPYDEAAHIWNEMIAATQPAGQRQRWYW